MSKKTKIEWCDSTVNFWYLPPFIPRTDPSPAPRALPPTDPTSGLTDRFEPVHDAASFCRACAHWPKTDLSVCKTCIRFWNPTNG